MPLTSAIQSAMAIRHEREKRHQRRLSKIRRESGVEGLPGSGGSSHRPSVSSLGSGPQARTGEQPEQDLAPPIDKEDSTFSTFHMGIVFILLGFLMIFFSMIPSAVIKADWSQLLGVGVAFIFIGLIMVMVNRIINAREEEELSKYVKQRLCRSRSSAAASLAPRPGDAEEGGGAAIPPSDIPEIVAPEELPPSAMKGASGHPPRSPKDKVTFDLDTGGPREGGEEGVIEDEETLPPLPPLLLPPCSLPLRLPAKPPPPLAVMEESGSELEEGADSLATPPTLPEEGGSSRGGSSICCREGGSSPALPPPSPGETASLLPREEGEGRRGSKRSY